MPHGRARVLRTSSQRKTSWTFGIIPSLSQTFAASGVGLFGGNDIVADGQTLIRVRGFLELILTSASALGDGFHGAVGIGVVQTAAFDTGVAAVPVPVADVTWNGWLWHQWFSLTAPTAAQVTENRQVFEVDSKAMRKLSADQTLFYAISATEVGTSGMIARMGIRSLVKLP